MIKAIETYYKGYRFRSRLEAKWAVYFDTIGLEWEYEKEGFKFDDGTCYLPDFWLPQVEMWAEVKPKEFSNEEINKVKLLVKEQNNSCILLIGPPKLTSYEFIFENEGELHKEDLMISMFHGYPLEEGRFYSSTGIKEPGKEWDIKTIKEQGFKDMIKAVNSSRSANFDRFNESKKDEEQ